MRHASLASLSLLVAAASVAACTSDSSSSATGQQGSAEGWQPPADPNRLMNPSPPPSDVAVLHASNASLAARLGAQIATKPGNLVYSPYGVSLDLAEVIAVHPGSKLRQFLALDLPVDALGVAFDALDLDLSSVTGKTQGGRGLQFQQASASWQAPNLAPSSTPSPLETYYGAQVLGGADPGAALATWQTAATPGPVIPVPLVGACDSFWATLVHFDAAWETPFDPNATHPGAFTRADASVVTTPMMKNAAFFPVYQSGTTKAVELPYDGGRFAMLVVTSSDLAAFEHTLTADALAKLVASLAPKEVDVTLPKFAITQQLDVGGALKALGWTFDWGGQTEVFQSADIQVNETATQATATTVTSHSPSAALPPAAALVFDHPFDFFVRDRKTGTILFSGRVADPGAVTP